jgi:hypothetical protein
VLKANQPESVRLTHEEAELVEDLIAEDQELQSLLRSHPSILIGNYKVTLRREDAAAFREYLMNRFDVFGLDEEYKPTTDGKLLESLIDKLFVLIAAGE